MPDNNYKFKIRVISCKGCKGAVNKLVFADVENEIYKPGFKNLEYILPDYITVTTDESLDYTTTLETLKQINKSKTVVRGFVDNVRQSDPPLEVNLKDPEQTEKPGDPPER